MSTEPSAESVGSEASKVGDAPLPSVALSDMQTVTVPAGDPTESVAGKSANPSARWSGQLPGELPAQFGRYHLLELLGKGGMGAVYLAHDPQLDRSVAIKIPNVPTGDGGEVKERFFREARAAATLAHPNLCPIFDVGECDGILYLTMAFIDGRPLSALIQNSQPVPLRQVALLVRQLASALKDAHEHGIIHRDLKPANVMLNRKDQPVIMDFGLARRMLRPEDVRLTQSGAIMGTPAYMSPEQVNGDVKAMGPGCDIYSLGVILYELLTGRLPFVGPLGTLMANILLEEPPPPSRFRRDLDRVLEAICLKALAKQPGDRHLSMGAFADALEKYLASETSPLPETMILEPILVALEVADSEAPPKRQSRASQARGEKQRSPRGAVPKKEGGWRGLLIGCGITMLLVGGLVGGVVWLVVSYGPGLKSFVERELKQHHQWDGLADFWRAPPADISAEELFPVELAGYRRTALYDKADVPQFKIKKEGRQAVYKRGDGEVEIYVWRATELEKELMLEKASVVVRPGKDGKSESHGSAISRGSPQGRYLTYTLGGVFGEPLNAGAFWWDKDWLFLARSSDVSDPGELLMAYLKYLGNITPSAKK